MNINMCVENTYPLRCRIASGLHRWGWNWWSRRWYGLARMWYSAEGRQSEILLWVTFLMNDIQNRFERSTHRIIHQIMIHFVGSSSNVWFMTGIGQVHAGGDSGAQIRRIQRLLWIWRERWLRSAQFGQWRIVQGHLWMWKLLMLRYWTSSLRE